MFPLDRRVKVCHRPTSVFYTVVKTDMDPVTKLLTSSDSNVRNCMKKLRHDCRSRPGRTFSDECRQCFDVVQAQFPMATYCDPLGLGDPNRMANLCDGKDGKYVPKSPYNVAQCEAATGLALVDSRFPSEVAVATEMGCQGLALMRASEYALQNGTCNDDTCGSGICFHDDVTENAYCVTPLTYAPHDATGEVVGGLVAAAVGGASLGWTERLKRYEKRGRQYESEGDMNAHDSAREFLENFGSRNELQNRMELLKLGPEAREIVENVGYTPSIAYALDSSLKQDRANEFNRFFNERSEAYRSAKRDNPSASHAREFNRFVAEHQRAHQHRIGGAE